MCEQVGICVPDNRAAEMLLNGMRECVAYVEVTERGEVLVHYRRSESRKKQERSK